jgi:hypothetical protein
MKYEIPDFQNNSIETRLQSYIESTAENIGLLERVANHTSMKTNLANADIEYKIVDEYKRDYAGIGGGENIEIGEYESPNGNGTIHFAEYSTRIAIDDYHIITYLYTSKPSKSDVIDAELMKQIETKFGKFGGLDAEFTCWECGMDTHVLDVDSAKYRESETKKLRQIVDIAKQKCCCL